MDAKMSDPAMNTILGYLVQSRDLIQAAIDDPDFSRETAGHPAPGPSGVDNKS